jgi:hypothetical protein
VAAANWAGTPNPFVRAGASGCKTGRFSDYAVGGARGEVWEKTGTLTEVVSSGNDKKATGSSTETHCVISGSAGPWWDRWQYGHRASSAALWQSKSLTTTVENASSASSASEIPRIRIVFRKLILVKPNYAIETPIIVTRCKTRVKRWLGLARNSNDYSGTSTWVPTPAARLPLLRPFRTAPGLQKIRGTAARSAQPQ